MFDCFADSKIHAEFNKWAALKPKYGNQSFNIHNGDQESWAELWPKFAKKYIVCRIPPRQFERPKPDASVMKLAEVPPYEDLGPITRMEGHVKQGRVEQRIDLVKWSRKNEVKEAWAKIAEKEGADKDTLKKATWGF